MGHTKVESDGVMNILKNLEVVDILTFNDESQLNIYFRKSPGDRLVIEESNSVSLNVSTNYRILKSGSVWLGDADVFHPPSNHVEGEDFDYKEDLSLFDEKVTALLGGPLLSVTDVKIDCYGGLTLSFSSGYVFEVFPAAGGNISQVEFWRIVLDEQEERCIIMSSSELEKTFEDDRYE